MRIIAGEFKGRKLLPPPGKSITRPITGSVKKSLFGMLDERLPGAAVLDLYCGTGTLGLEALSRGAGNCVFVERDRAVLERLERNIETIGVGERCHIWRGDVMRQLARRLREFDGQVNIAFVDPPYALSRQWNWREANTRLFRPVAARLAPDGLIVLRTPHRVDLPDTLGPLEIRRSRKYGEMVVTIYGGGA